MAGDSSYKCQSGFFFFALVTGFDSDVVTVEGDWGDGARRTTGLLPGLSALALADKSKSPSSQCWLD